MPEKLCRGQNGNTPEWVEDEEVLIAGYKDGSFGGNRDFQEVIVFWISAGAKFLFRNNQASLSLKKPRNGLPLFGGKVDGQPGTGAYAQEFFDEQRRSDKEELPVPEGLYNPPVGSASEEA